jgi:LuxR family quorum-sensing system transcriptional regulator CciR
MRISEFIERTNEASSTAEIFELLQSAVGEFGYDRLAFGALTTPAQAAFKTDKPIPAVALNYPEDWVKHYFASRYETLDPVVLTTPYRRNPFIWDHLVSEIEFSDAQTKFFHEADDAGLHQGVSIPIHGPRGECFVVSLASSSRDAEGEARLRTLQILAMQFQINYANLIGQTEFVPDIHLTPREKECLLWSARGKSAWSTGMILKISEHTVNFHLKNAMSKLGTTNKIIAVVKAMRMRLIDP